LEASEMNGPDANYILADDILHGAQEIAEFGGWTRRQVYHFVSKHDLPVIRIGSALSARKTSILKWIGQREGVRPSRAENPGPAGSPPRDRV
jgi:predicted DNA-binding transcriptional regulator AlpA